MLGLPLKSEVGLLLSLRLGLGHAVADARFSQDVYWVARVVSQLSAERLDIGAQGSGLGTRSIFSVPAVEEAVHGSANGPGPLSADSGWTARGRARVLVDDDETQVLRHVRSALSEAGYATIVTGNPDEVERLIEAEKPHLVLMDVALPGTDGIELFDSRC